MGFIEQLADRLDQLEKLNGVLESAQNAMVFCQKVGKLVQRIDLREPVEDVQLTVDDDHPDIATAFLDLIQASGTHRIAVSFTHRDNFQQVTPAGGGAGLYRQRRYF